MKKNSYEIQTEQFQAALRARATALYERAIVIKSEYNEALQQASYQLTNLGIDVPFCLLTIQVRLRAQRPEFAWRRSKYREGKKLRSLPCSRTSLSKYTNDMDHKIVLRTERELAKLRKIWKLSGKALRDTKHLLRLNEQAGVGGIRDMTDHYPALNALGISTEHVHEAATPVSDSLSNNFNWEDDLQPFRFVLANGSDEEIVLANSLADAALEIASRSGWHYDPEKSNDDDEVDTSEPSIENPVPVTATNGAGVAPTAVKVVDEQEIPLEAFADFPRSDWENEVQNDETNLSYFGWVRHKLDAETIGTDASA